MKAQGDYTIKSYAVIILAAGSSSRLGRPKQLLAYRGKTLLQHAIDSAKATKAKQTLVVLGAVKELINNQIDDKGIVRVDNPNWQSGLASSIKAGINALNSNSPNLDAAILMVCDQPFADATILISLLAKQAETGDAIVGCSYDDTKGIPALFHSSLFTDLLSLEGDAGAKKLFDKYKEVSSFVSFKQGGIDIDTSEDYKNLAK
ncbi:nucleotidyltransferase family protein [Daejeonella lutea]|uniref:Molybdenum cofactor cytidylyltransferase n=1 Tax=Daejeonella lutea TaxID=572036 RepID=A0A1T4ZX58_9SPHI|nr:nucleotidyltransferase family protein [Daejeonella lutea]SKB27308.1 molybdenum cofactor cytidylyltransferase [Daejeonella lutea]